MMNTKELWEQYRRHYFKITAYRLMLSTVSFDNDTIAPEKGDEYRNERIAFMDGELFALANDENYLKLLRQLNQCDDLTDTQKRIVRWNLADLEKMKNVPRDFYEEFSHLMLESYVAWDKARDSKDYKMFEPYLLKLIEKSKEMLKYRETEQLKGYDVFLDDFEPGMNREKYDRFFNLIREKLVPLIRKIGQKEKIDDAFVYDFYPKDRQKEMMYRLLKYLDFDLKSGVLAETPHPYSNSLSKYDNRITTHYYENNLLSSIFSVIHETGHATYNHQVADELAETYAFDNMSSGMHESQSRLLENYLGRDRAFWEANFDSLKELFPQQLKDVDIDKFVRAANASCPSLVRTEADELTYPLHILIRYEIEKGIFDGTVDVNDLENIWNDKYEEYLGVRPSNAAEGILQDVHWSGASFGYFPTYALGSGYAAQFVAAMKKDLDVEKCMRENRFGEIKKWLEEHIHKYGGLYSPDEQIELATGEPFDPQYYIDYLTDKYTRLYGLDQE